MVFSILLFAALGFAFGYATGGLLAWVVALGLPILVAVATVSGGGFDDFNVVAFIITLVLTAAAVVLGEMARARGEQRPGQA